MEQKITLRQMKNPEGSECLRLDSQRWNYDVEHDVYWQLGLPYCTAPTAHEYHSLGVFVPGAYMKRQPDGSVIVDLSGKLCGFTATDAPIAMPVDTPGYWAMSAPTEYDYERIAKFMQAGMIYLHTGCRGRESGTNPDGSSFCGGAPWGVTDMKSAARWLRYNRDLIPGDADRVFTFGFSGGGAQSALMGAAGDSDLYAPYLQINGALMRDQNGEYISDAVCGSMCWCPVTTLGPAGAAYEWMMGQHFDIDSRSPEKWTSELSESLAEYYIGYVNRVGFTGENGEKLTLKPSEEGTGCAGSYYDYVLRVIEASLKNYLYDEFSDAAQRKAYIDSLNADGEWVSFDETNSTVSISSIAGFVRRCKFPFKKVGAFDDIHYQQIENVLFGTPEKPALHFDVMMAEAAAENAEAGGQYDDYVSDLAESILSDVLQQDCAGYNVGKRLYMYDPLNFIISAKQNPQKSGVAKYWRINSGIEQGDTSLTTELNLALMLRACPQVSCVDFTTVWRVGHTFAERKGDCMDNLIAWIKECLLP